MAAIGDVAIIRMGHDEVTIADLRRRVSGVDWAAFRERMEQMWGLLIEAFRYLAEAFTTAIEAFGGLIETLNRPVARPYWEDSAFVRTRTRALPR